MYTLGPEVCIVDILGSLGLDPRGTFGASQQLPGLEHRVVHVTGQRLAWAVAPCQAVAAALGLRLRYNHDITTRGIKRTTTPILQGITRMKVAAILLMTADALLFLVIIIIMIMIIIIIIITIIIVIIVGITIMTIARIVLMAITIVVRIMNLTTVRSNGSSKSVIYNRTKKRQPQKNKKVNKKKKRRRGRVQT